MRAPVALCFSIGIQVAFAQAGTLDPSFSGDGIAPISFGGLSATGQAVAVQADQKIVVVGYAGAAPNQTFAVARFTTSGTADNTFSGDGWTTTAIGTGDALARSVLVQPDQKILAAGIGHSDAGWNAFGMARYTADGNLDASFGNGGKVATQIGPGASRGSAVALQSDGKIIMVGYSYGGDPDTTGVVRYNPDGTVDHNFASGGIFQFGGVGNFDAYATAVQPDGRIVVVGDSGGFSTYRTFVLRLNSDGTLDGSFGNGGLTSASMGAGASEGYGVVLQPDGKIITCGRSNSTGNYDLILFRFNSDGTLDTAFDGDGRVSTALTVNNDAGTGVALQLDGKIVAGGFSGAGGTIGVALVRYLADGTPDDAFGTNGVAEAPTGSGYGLAIQADGRIVVGGVSADVLTAYRYISEASGMGIHSLAEEVEAVRLFPDPVIDQLVLEYTLTSTAQVSYIVCDENGRMVRGYSKSVLRDPGAQRETLDCGHLAIGRYTLTVTIGGARRSLPFVKL